MNNIDFGIIISIVIGSYASILYALITLNKKLSHIQKLLNIKLKKK